MTAQVATLDEHIDRWRSYLHRRQAIHAVDVAELEDHLREQIVALTAAGLATDTRVRIHLILAGTPRQSALRRRRFRRF